MAYSYKTKENLQNGATQYSRYYSAFRGVDFSSDHTQVNSSRLAYLVNMYKDYHSGQGEALETIAGFRQRANFAVRPTIAANGIDTHAPTVETDKEVYGIFYFKCKVAGVETTRVLVHSGKKLFLWHNYPTSINIPTEAVIVAPTPSSITQAGGTEVKTFSLVLPYACDAVIDLKRNNGDYITNVSYEKTSNTLAFFSSAVQTGERLNLSYYEGVSVAGDILYSGMNLRQSVSFVFNNRLYILDGKNYLVYDGETVSLVKDNAYVPTTYIGIIPSGENRDNGKEHEPRNMLTPKFKTTFKATGDATEYFLNEDNLDSVISVKVYDDELSAGTDYTVDLPNGKITFVNAPKKPEETAMKDSEGNLIPYDGDGAVPDSDGQGKYLPYGKGHFGVEITAAKTWTTLDGVKEETDIADIISGCTLCTTFDDRVFLSGNPNYHNLLFWCRRTSGYSNPSYFSVIDWVPDGVGSAPITGLMCVSDTLMVLKADTQQDSSVYFHTAETGDDIATRIYPKKQGLSGLGCVGACCNFLDDPIFISRLGVEGVSQLKIAAERANEHRSKLIDARLVNTDLSKARLEEWGGYLCLLTEGKIFLADSRQRYTDTTGAMQYEWYYLENIGVWENQYREYKYSSLLAEEIKGTTFTHEGQKYEIELAENVFFPDVHETRNLCGAVANEPDGEGLSDTTIHNQVIAVNIAGVDFPVEIAYTIHTVKDTMTGEITERHAYLCESRGNYTGGLFQKATVLKNMNENLFFGCANGVVCSFNFDQRDENGELPPQAYHFDNRTILCGCATLMDNCEIPHLTKTTIKRSVVIKTKSFKNSAAKVKVRTNKKPYEQIARINSNLFSFNDVDFSDFSFITTDQSLFAIKEKEKQWVEKQYYIYSDEYLKPFSLYYIAFRYRVAGRYKN